MKYDINKIINGELEYILSIESIPSTLVGTLVINKTDTTVSSILENEFGGTWSLYSNRGLYSLWKSDNRSVIVIYLKRGDEDESV